MKTIAVIDDDIYIGNMLEELLRGNGYGLMTFCPRDSCILSIPMILTVAPAGLQWPLL